MPEMGDRRGVMTWKRKPIRDSSGRRIGWSYSRNADKFETADTEQPWIVYLFLTSDRRTRLTGRSRIRLTCAVCGTRHTLSLRIPRFGPIPEPKAGQHLERLRFKREHLHPDRPHPMSWSLPLLNPAAHKGGIDLDLLALRLDADIQEAQNT